MEDLGSALQTWEDMVDRYNNKNANVGAVELDDDIKCSAVESMTLENFERHLNLNARRLKKYGDVPVESHAYFESCTGNILKTRTREVASRAGSCDDLMEVDLSCHNRQIQGQEQRERQRK